MTFSIDICAFFFLLSLYTHPRPPKKDSNVYKNTPGISFLRNMFYLMWIQPCVELARWVELAR